MRTQTCGQVGRGVVGFDFLLSRGGAGWQHYFAVMKIITDERCAEFFRPGHPERPERVLRSLELLRGQTEIAIDWIPASPPSEEAILRAHSPAHLERLSEPGDFDADTPNYSGIVEYARASAGSALRAMKLARGGEPSFSLMRPPGHHATRERAMGFCYLNNMAIAALEAMAQGVKRLGVFDFDVHHGNGTEDILLERPGTAFVSVHQSPCYPGTGTHDVGSNCWNFPVPPGTPRPAYRKILAAALQRLKSFHPELIGVSAGFDAYARDPLADGTLEAEDFQWLGIELRAMGIPVFSLLEGGYSKDLPHLILAYLKGLEGQSN